MNAGMDVSRPRLCLPLGQARFLDPLWDQVQQLSIYIKEVYDTLVTLHSMSPASVAANHTRITSLIVALFIVAVAVCNIVYFPLIIRALNKSIKGNRALLLLLPSDVVTSVPMLKETMTALTKKLVH